MHLNNRARDLLDKYSSGMAQQFGARDTSRYFSLNDPQENALRLALLESVEFLNMITCLDVDQLSGQVISVGSSVLHTGRSENGRFVRQVGVDGNDYSLVETDSCAALRWDLLSVWANAGKDENEFYNLVQAFAAEQYRLYQAADRPTEKIAAQMLGSTIAGRPAVIPPFMPGKRMVVTPLSNLHIYTQRNTRMRKAEFVEDRKQFENKYLRNEGYAVEVPELYAAIDESAVTIGKVSEPAEG
ncbi:P2 family phage major capsid protein [Citrobacter youngae]